MRKLRDSIYIPETSLPHPLDVISEVLPKLKLPHSDFEPTGEWNHKYTSWIALRGPAGNSHLAGSLLIQRSKGFRGRYQLKINQSTHFNWSSKETQRVDIVCANDKLSTPDSWSSDFSIVDRKDKPVEYSSLHTEGTFSNGRIILSSLKAREIKVGKQYTCNWSLFDAVQRLPFDSKTIEFDLLDDMELLKPRQRLSCGPTAEIEIGGKKTTLHSFVQVGDGILPITYWLDDQHRLIYVAGGIRTFIYDPESVLMGDKK